MTMNMKLKMKIKMKKNMKIYEDRNKKMSASLVITMYLFRTLSTLSSKLYASQRHETFCTAQEAARDYPKKVKLSSYLQHFHFLKHY